MRAACTVKFGNYYLQGTVDKMFFITVCSKAILLGPKSSANFFHFNCCTSLLRSNCYFSRNNKIKPKQIWTPKYIYTKINYDFFATRWRCPARRTCSVCTAMTATLSSIYSSCRMNLRQKSISEYFADIRFRFVICMSPFFTNLMFLHVFLSLALLNFIQLEHKFFLIQL